MIKDIAVHLTGSDEDGVRLAHAEPLARQFDAHLTGLFLAIQPDVITATTARGAAVVTQIADDLRAESDAAHARLRQRLDHMESRTSLRRFDVTWEKAAGILASEARTADLFVGTRPYGSPDWGRRIEETVLFDSGRSCLFVPPKSTPPPSYGKIVVGWKDSRESARALAEAMPLLRLANEVIVVTIEESGENEPFAGQDGPDVARHLSRHGVPVILHTINGFNFPGEVLLDEAARVDADLLVIGAYGHSRFREWILGGATRHILEAAAIPVLAAR